MIKQEREHALREMGIALKDDGDAVGVFSPQKVIYIIIKNIDSHLHCHMLWIHFSHVMTKVIINTFQ